MRYLFSTLLLAGIGLLTLTQPIFAQIAVNPQVGLSASRLSSDPEGAESSAHLGYQLGGYLRMGKQLYFMPGLFYQRTGSELRTADDITLEELKDQVDISGLLINLGLGYNVVNEQMLKLRVHGSLAGTTILSVGDNDLGLSEELFKDFFISAPIGIGVDLFGFLSADLISEYGLSNVFEVFDIKIHVIRFNVGVVL